MIMLWSVNGCTKDRIYSDDICKRVEHILISKITLQKTKRWFPHLNRMPDGRLPKKVQQHKSTRQSHTGRSLGEVVVFPLRPEQVICLFLDRRKTIIYRAGVFILNQYHTNRKLDVGAEFSSIETQLVIFRLDVYKRQTYWCVQSAIVPFYSGLYLF